MAIGAQNAHVIKYGISGRNVFSVALTCFLCDVILMTCGVFFIGSVSTLTPWINIVICILSISFLLVYSFRSFLSAWRNHDLSDFSFNILVHRETITQSVLTTLAITLLNPHVYLDTVVVVGGYAASLSYQHKLFFLSGALLASLAWFFSLSYFSKYLSRFFKSAKTWVCFDLCVALFMLVLAVNLILYLCLKVL
ncbi:LysE/ArgO family amino acid transporter [Enterobacteriaceae bacterium LUAb1]